MSGLAPVPELLTRLRAARDHAKGVGAGEARLSAATLHETVTHLERLTDPTPRSRTGNPETSRAAAAKVARGQGAQHRAILAALASHDATAPEIAERTKLGWYDGLPCLSQYQIGKRTNELVRAGLIEADGERDGFTIYRLVARP